MITFFRIRIDSIRSENDNNISIVKFDTNYIHGIVQNELKIKQLAPKIETLRYSLEEGYLYVQGEAYDDDPNKLLGTFV